MGLYNKLEISIECEKCHKEFNGQLQFKVGDVDLNKYVIGDSIKTQIKDGELKEKEITAYGILENAICPVCGYSNPEEYDIIIKNLTIISYNKMLDYSPYASFEGGNYYVRR